MKKLLLAAAITVGASTIVAPLPAQQLEAQAKSYKTYISSQFSAHSSTGFYAKSYKKKLTNGLTISNGKYNSYDLARIHIENKSGRLIFNDPDLYGGIDGIMRYAVSSKGYLNIAYQDDGRGVTAFRVLTISPSGVTYALPRKIVNNDGIGAITFVNTNKVKVKTYQGKTYVYNFKNGKIVKTK